MSEPEPRARERCRELEAEAIDLSQQIAALRAERDKWKEMSRGWQKRCKQNKADLDTATAERDNALTARDTYRNHLDLLRGEIVKAARRAALLAGENPAVASARVMNRPVTVIPAGDRL